MTEDFLKEEKDVQPNLPKAGSVDVGIEGNDIKKTDAYRALRLYSKLPFSIADLHVFEGHKREELATAELRGVLKLQELKDLVLKVAGPDHNFPEVESKEMRNLLRRTHLELTGESWKEESVE